MTEIELLTNIQNLLVKQELFIYCLSILIFLYIGYSIIRFVFGRF